VVLIFEKFFGKAGLSSTLPRQVFWRRLSSHTNALKRTKSRINSWLQLLVAQQVPEYFALFHNPPFNCAKYRGGCVIPVDSKIRDPREPYNHLLLE
jgi:hypothetical protein